MGCLEATRPHLAAVAVFGRNFAASYQQRAVDGLFIRGQESCSITVEGGLCGCLTSASAVDIV